MAGSGCTVGSMKVLVTAGPTREALDPVRFISNRSTGRMGYAIARAALGRGHEVKLISGPVALPPPDGADVIDVVSAADMLTAVSQCVPWCTALVMSAAVADWRPRAVSPAKLKKRDMRSVLELEPTDDILMAVRGMKADRLFVGFAAETGSLLAEGRRKLADKGLDLVVANDVSRPDAGFAVDTNQVTLILPDGTSEHWELQSKDAVAARLVRWLEDADAARENARP